ncbi:MAG: hypothetical protein HYX78_09270 [Armatimonadetes bacterium]|nr:hypothetical protein [Armatimonadota bacterium]
MKFHRIKIVVALAVALSVAATSSSYAALCVWRKPDQDIKEFFPGAETYKTEYKKPSGSQEKAIEKRIGTSLDPDESEFKFYRILNGGKQVGTILTHLGKGQFGAIEIVVALDNNAKIKGTAIQRDREKKRAELRSDKFLGQFRGKDKNDPIKTGQDINPVPGAEKSSETVAFSVRKLLVVYDILN